MAAPLSLEQRIQRLEDIEEIRHLKARYCKYTDVDMEGRGHDPEDVVSLFTDDATIDTPFHHKVEGKEGVRDHYQTVLKKPPFVLHMLMNHTIEVSSDTATGEWCSLVAATTPDNEALWNAGYYDENYRRTADGWKISSMKLNLAFLCLYETGWAKTS